MATNGAVTEPLAKSMRYDMVSKREPAMRGCTGLAALTLSLAAFPALAQEPGDGGYRMKGLSPGAAAPLFEGQRPGLNLAREDVVRGDGSPATRTRLFGSLPVYEGLDVGIGIFSVIGETEKQMVRRRTDPSHEVGGQDSKVAAVGLSLRF
jgi:hypothetical protein